MSIAPPRPELRLTPDAHSRLVKAVESFQRLLVLDHAWTALTGQVRHAGTGESFEETAAALGGQILVSLQVAHEGADWLRDYVLGESPARIADAVEAALSGHETDEAKEAAWQVFAEYRDRLGELTETGYAQFVDGLPEQRRAIAVDLVRLLEGGEPDGDLLKAIHCGLASLTIVGGLVMVAIPPWAHGAVMVTSGAAAWKTFGCRFT